MKTPRGCF